MPANVVYEVIKMYLLAYKVVSASIKREGLEITVVADVHDGYCRIRDILLLKDLLGQRRRRDSL